MKGGTKAALAIVVGYVLGRRRKMRTMTLLAAATATGSMGGLGATALRRGAKMLSSTEMFDKLGPQVGDIAEIVRGDLLDAGKAAAAAALSSRIDTFSDALHDRAEAFRDPGAAAAEVGEKAGSSVRSLRRRGRRTADDEVEPEDLDEREDEEDEQVEEPEDLDETPEDLDETEEPEDLGEPDEPEDLDEPEDEDDDSGRDDVLDEAEDEDEDDFEDAGEPDDDEPEDEPDAAPARRRTARRSPVSRVRS
jgi:hypothetical protein